MKLTNLSGSQINTLQMMQDKINNRMAIFQPIFDEFYSDDAIFFEAYKIIEQGKIELHAIYNKMINK